MGDEGKDTPAYIHGSSPEEQERLSLLNSILNTACLAEMNLMQGARVLDLGSGLGQFTGLMAEAVGAGAHVLGIERDPRQIKAARDLAKTSGATNVEFREGDAMALPLKGSEWGAFDVAHARFLLEHTPHPELVVDQIARAVRPGGRVILCDDDHGDFRPWPEPPGFSSLWAAYVAGFRANGCDPFVGRRLVSLLSDAGLRPVRNGGVFFGGCKGDDKFDATAANLIAAFRGAKDAMLSGGALTDADFTTSMDALLEWKDNAASALWYSACFAEAVVPD